MFNTYSSSFYGCGYKVKKALKFAVTSVSALKALCPIQNLSRIFHALKQMKAKKKENFVISRQLIHFAMGLGPQ